MHRDIKPQNILIDLKENSDVDKIENITIKIADFGLARSYESLRPFTIEVVSPYYRAPEIFLGQTEYSSKIDVWAVGCIFAEMVLGKILFKGDREIDQLKKIFRYIKQTQ